MNKKYEYEGMPVTVHSAEYIISNHTYTPIDKGAVSIKRIEKHVLKKHKEMGGLPPADGLKRPVFIALCGLLESGKTNSFGKDTWYIAGSYYQRILGSGKHWVYLYYFEKDRREAKSKNKEVWPCKIGETDKKPEARIKGQTRGTPVPPRIALLLRTNQNIELEGAIHRILKLRGKHRNDLQGKEWFDTTPDEVKSIYDFIMENK